MCSEVAAFASAGVLPLPQFITKCKSERIVDIGPHLPKLSWKEVTLFYLKHGVVTTTSRTRSCTQSKRCAFVGKFAVQRLVQQKHGKIESALWALIGPIRNIVNCSHLQVTTLICVKFCLLFPEFKHEKLDNFHWTFRLCTEWRRCASNWLRMSETSQHGGSADGTGCYREQSKITSTWRFTCSTITNPVRSSAVQLLQLSLQVCTLLKCLHCSNVVVITSSVDQAGWRYCPNTMPLLCENWTSKTRTIETRRSNCFLVLWPFVKILQTNTQAFNGIIQ